MHNPILDKYNEAGKTANIKCVHYVSDFSARDYPLAIQFHCKDDSVHEIDLTDVAYDDYRRQEKQFRATFHNDLSAS